ncbi:hypothetical protein BC834DRAFT_534129 [Gloeopeniophorella convolvens]|nr:hypothetical protein BC834DRAFT_534129 [Gloeopeniophorella convolvens]
MEHRKRTADEMSSSENLRSTKSRQEDASSPACSSRGHTVTTEQRQSNEMNVDEPLDPITVCEPTTSTVPMNPPAVLDESNTSWAVPDEPGSEMVQEDISDDGHAHLDKLLRGGIFSSVDILSTVKPDTSGFVATALQEVIRGCLLLDRKYHSLQANANLTQLVAENPWLSSLVMKCSKLGSAREIRRLKILRPPERPKAVGIYRGRETIVEESWECDYRGDAARVLLITISDYLVVGRGVYFQHANIVNSSGTGKSRMVDELSKTIITVPMCLRDPASTGFPPPDDALRDWLLEGSRSQEDTERKMHGFMHSLLRTTLDRLQGIEALRGASNARVLDGKAWSINDLLNGSYLPSDEERGSVDAFLIERQRRLATGFRDLMTKGQRFGRVNNFRQEFFQDVIRGAESVCPCIHVPSTASLIQILVLDSLWANPSRRQG